MKKHIIISSIVIGTLMLCLKSNRTKATFKDIKGNWAQKEIEFLANEGVIGGFKDGTFRPDDQMTRAEFGKILAGVIGINSKENVIPNLEDHWSSTYLNGLIEEGIIDLAEYPNGYHPHEEITRLEMSKMFARGLARSNKQWNETLELLKNLEEIALPFEDDNYIDEYDQPFVALAYGSGIVNGYRHGLFAPNGLATRAQGAVMLKRFLDKRRVKPEVSKIVYRFQPRE